MLDFTTDAAKIVSDFAPASLSTSAAPTVSSRYAFINSAKALDILADYGFHATAAQQQGSRDKSKAPYAAHMLRFQNEAFRTSEGIPELLLLNSHNRRTSLGLGQGFFRYACSNNVVMATSGIFQRLRHNAATAEAFENLVKEKAAGLPETMARIERMQGQSIDAYAARWLVGAMCEARGWKFSNVERSGGLEPDFVSPASLEYLIKKRGDATINLGTGKITYKKAHLTSKNQTYFTSSTLNDLLTSRRDADSRSTVWNIFNRVQECFCSANNGFRPVRVVSTSTKYPEGRYRNARSIRSIAGNTALNAKLFDLAEGVQ